MWMVFADDPGLVTNHTDVAFLTLGSCCSVLGGVELGRRVGCPVVSVGRV